MNRNELEAAAEERLFDVMLGEVAREPVGEVRGGARGSRWLAAAIVLLGLAVVAGVVLTSRATPSTAVAPQERAPWPQEPAPLAPVIKRLPPVVTVRGMAELLKADRKIENLWCAIEGPDFGVLQEFMSLRALHVEQDHDLPHPTLVQSAWSLAPLAHCTKLESLSVGRLARFTVTELAPIAALANLRSLELGSLDYLNVPAAEVLAKLPLRSLVLRDVFLVRDGLRVLGELPLLERLELRDCTGLDRCDLKHLYRLRQLRALTLRGVGRPPVQQVVLTGEPVSIQLAEVRNGRIVREITGEWVKGLAGALPGLRELDFAESRIDDQVLIDLPHTLTFLGLREAKGYGEPGMAAVGALSTLQGFACGEPPRTTSAQDQVPFANWWPVLGRMKLQRFEFAGVPKEELVAALREQTGLRELRLDAWPWTKFSFRKDGKEGPLELPMPSFACLAELPELRRVELVQPSVGLEKAVRAAVPAGVTVEVLPPR